MKILKILLLVVLAATACFLLLAITKPNTYHVERSVTIAAPPAAVFAVVNDFHNWEKWSPWERLDPAMKRTTSGAESGVGAVYHWVGNKDVGEGRMTITESDPDSHIGIRLEFIKPWTSTSTIHFRFAPEGEGTRVTWAMEGNAEFMTKVMSVFASMDKMIGPDFETGLGQLKTLAESAPAPADSTRTPVPVTSK